MLHLGAPTAAAASTQHPSWRRVCCSKRHSRGCALRRLGKKNVLSAQQLRDQQVPALNSQGHGHGKGHGSNGHASMPYKKGFVNEMRKVAMKLHTREQAPKEGQNAVKTEEQKSMRTWEPTIPGYLQFLAESKVLYDALEDIVNTSDNPDYAKIRGTGLERGAALAKDLAWFKSDLKAEPRPISKDGPALSYVEYLRDKASTDPPAFICHWYNIYFAHSAGGLMIGKKVSNSLLQDRTLNYYKWDGDLQSMLAEARDHIDEIAASWTPEKRKHCLDETELSFKYSGALLRLIVEKQPAAAL